MRRKTAGVFFCTVPHLRAGLVAGSSTLPLPCVAGYPRRRHKEEPGEELWNCGGDDTLHNADIKSYIQPF